MTWGPTGIEIAFVYDDDLYIYDLDDNEARQVTRDDNNISNPTWAPYGRGALETVEQDLEQEDEIPTPLPEPPWRGDEP